MSRERRHKMVDRQHPKLPTVRQCALVGISRSSLYYRPRGTSPEDLTIMKLMDQQYLTTPFYGSPLIIFVGYPGSVSICPHEADKRLLR